MSSHIIQVTLHVESVGETTIHVEYLQGSFLNYFRYQSVTPLEGRESYPFPTKRLFTAQENSSVILNQKHSFHCRSSVAVYFLAICF